jgi:hypothetical protein
MNQHNHMLADEQKDRNRAEPESESHADTERLCKLFLSRTKEEQAAILELVSTSFTMENNPVTRYLNQVKQTDQAEQERVAKLIKKHVYALAKFMQILPGDITNQAVLTPNQAKLCMAVSRLAKLGERVLKEGLVMMDDLMGMALGYTEIRYLDNFDIFVAYLEEALRFMQQSASEYEDAAIHIEKKWPENEGNLG